MQDFTPDNHSIINVVDYTSIHQLVSVINKLSSDEQGYNSYRKFKRQGGVTNRYLRETLEKRLWEPDFDVEVNQERIKPNFPDIYLCLVCEMMNNINKHSK